MTAHPAFRALGAALCLAAALVPACDRPKNAVEIVSDAEERKAVIKVASSDAAYAAFLKIVEEYSSRHNVRFEVSNVQSGNIVDLVGKKTVDIGVMTRRLERDERSQGLNYIPFADDGVVFLASRDAGVRALSSEQIRRILSGSIANWKEVGGADGPIHVICRPPNSSVSLALGASLYRGKFPPVKSAFVLETNDSAYQAMKSLSSYLAVVPMSRTIVEQFPADALTVDGMPPLQSNVPFAKYPARLEYGIMFPKDAPEAVAEFARYLVSLEGMHKLASMGLMPSPRNLSMSSCHCRATDGAFAPSREAELAGLLTIGVVPELGAIEQERRYAGICKVIAEEMGVKTYLKHMETYGQVVREFAEGKIDAAFVGSLVYGKLHDRFGVVALARPEAGGVSRYRGLVIVRADGGIRAFSGLRGRRFACAPDTTAGDLFVRTLAAPAGADPARYFSRLVAVPSHSEAVRLLERGEVDGAAVKNLVLDRLIAASPGLKGRFRTIETSPTVPENALVVHPRVAAKQRRDLLRILLACDRQPAGRAALAAMGADRFVVTTHEDYDSLYAMARSVGYDFGK